MFKVNNKGTRMTPFRYTLKALKNLWFSEAMFSDVFRGYRNGAILVSLLLTLNIFHSLC